jgi:hypothetical protein
MRGKRKSFGSKAPLKISIPYFVKVLSLRSKDPLCFFKSNVLLYGKLNGTN